MNVQRILTKSRTRISSEYTLSADVVNRQRTEMRFTASFRAKLVALVSAHRQRSNSEGPGPFSALDPDTIQIKQLMCRSFRKQQNNSE